MSQQPPTPEAILIVHAEDFRRRTGISHEDWAERVDRAYCERIPEDQRQLAAPDLQRVEDADTFTKLRRAWDQCLRRYCSGERAFPMQLMWAWVDALDEDWRTQCGRELVLSLGFVGAKAYEPSGKGDTRAWGSALRDFGHLTQTMAEVLEDGEIGEQDREHLPSVIRHCQAIRADAASIEEQARRVMKEPPVRVVS